EGVATPTLRGLLRVQELEPPKHHGVHVVQRRVVQVDQALLVHVEANPVVLRDRISRARFVVGKLDDVRKPTAPATLDAQTYSGVRRTALFQTLLGVLHGRCRNVNTTQSLRLTGFGIRGRRRLDCRIGSDFALNVHGNSRGQRWLVVNLITHFSSATLAACFLRKSSIALLIASSAKTEQ